MSGERLRARFWQGADGSRQFIGWYDSELEVECSFALAADGKTRCVPGVDDALASDDTRFFVDSACTSPAIRILDEQCMPALVSIADPKLDDACGAAPGFRVYPVDAPVPPGAVVYFKPQANGPCVEVPGSSSGYFSLGAETPPSKLVLGELETE